MPAIFRLQVLDNEAVFLQDSARYLERRGHRVVSARGPTKAREMLQKDILSATTMDDRLERGDVLPACCGQFWRACCAENGRFNLLRKCV